MRIIDPREQHAKRLPKLCESCGQELPKIEPKPPEPIARASVVLCDITMPLTGERCARRAGHSDSHRSRDTMDNDARARAARYQRMAGWA